MVIIVFLYSKILMNKMSNVKNSKKKKKNNPGLTWKNISWQPIFEPFLYESRIALIESSSGGCFFFSIQANFLHY